VAGGPPPVQNGLSDGDIVLGPRALMPRRLRAESAGHPPSRTAGRRPPFQVGKCGRRRRRQRGAWGLDDATISRRPAEIFSGPAARNVSAGALQTRSCQAGEATVHRRTTRHKPVRRFAALIRRRRALPPSGADAGVSAACNRRSTSDLPLEDGEDARPRLRSRDSLRRLGPQGGRGDGELKRAPQGRALARGQSGSSRWWGSDRNRA